LNGVKVGVFGLGIALEGLVTKRLYKETVYLEPIEIAQSISNTLKKEEQCDLVICLSHLGYSYNDLERPDDLKLAAGTENIELIIGGHTHTFLEKPTIAKNRKGKQVLVNQVGCYGLNLGRIDFYFDSEKNLTVNGVSIKV
jgi:5'-nucleotidase